MHSRKKPLRLQQQLNAVLWLLVVRHVSLCRWQVAAEKEERAKEEAVRARKAAVQR